MHGGSVSGCGSAMMGALPLRASHLLGKEKHALRRQMMLIAVLFFPYSPLTSLQFLSTTL